MGCFQSRIKTRPFAGLRQFIRDQEEQRRERKRLKEQKRLNVLTGSAPRSPSPTPNRAVSTHTSLVSTSLDIANEGSMQSLSDSSDSSDSFSSLDVFEQETSNVLDGDDDDEEDYVHPLAPAMTVTTLSDADDNDENGVRNLSMGKSRSDQIEVVNRATAAAAARQRALNRATVSITATGIRSRLRERDSVLRRPCTRTPTRGQMTSVCRASSPRQGGEGAWERLGKGE